MRTEGREKQDEGARRRGWDIGAVFYRTMHFYLPVMWPTTVTSLVSPLFSLPNFFFVSLPSVSLFFLSFLSPSLSIYVSIDLSIYLFIYLSLTNTNTRAHTRWDTHTHTYTHTNTHSRTHSRTHAHTHTSIHAHMKS